MTTSVGVRELRQQASALLRRVESGETIQITDRGRPVAVLAPIAGQGPLERLWETGDLVPAQTAMDSLPPPLEVPTGGETPSAVLARLRRDER